MPQVRAVAHINPRLRHGYGQTTSPIPQISFQHYRVLIVSIVITFPVSIATMFRQDVIPSNAQDGISTMNEFRNVRGTLEDYFQARHAPNASQILTWITPVNF